jgi:hypothetical protein
MYIQLDMSSATTMTIVVAITVVIVSLILRK